jgi:hypothetical protein
VRARRPQPRPANSCMRRSERSAAASMGRDHHSRRLRSAYPRRGVRGLLSARREKARPRRRLAKVPNMPMRRGKASGSLAVGRASRAPCRAPSSANPAARHRARRSRSRRDAPPRAAPRPLVPRPPERPRGRRAPRAALPQPRKRLGPERAADDNARCPKFRALSGVQDRSGPHPFRALARMARRLPTRAKLIGWRR